MRCESIASVLGKYVGPTKWVDSGSIGQVCESSGVSREWVTLGACVIGTKRSGSDNASLEGQAKLVESGSLPRLPVAQAKS